MKHLNVILACLVLLGTPLSAAAQTGNERTKTTLQIAEEAERAKVAKQFDEIKAAQAKLDAQSNARFVRTLTNVQIELTLTDQVGSAAPEKKSVSMIVSSGNWGKIRSVGNVEPVGDRGYVVDLNVDARPFVSVEGPIQLELTVNYAPPKGAADPREPKQRPTGINQSQTVVLTSGKPLIISQAADPLSDRKVIVEVKATVLK